jgi:NADH:ubiquinone oxidoreductase subunit 2 (subunit N)
MNLGAFLVVIALRRQGIIGEDVDDLQAWFTRVPATPQTDPGLPALARRIPPTAGFPRARTTIFLSLIETQTLHAVGGCDASTVAVAIYYYFRPSSAAWFVGELTQKEPVSTSMGPAHSPWPPAAIMTLAIGIYPEPFLQNGAEGATK